MASTCRRQRPRPRTRSPSPVELLDRPRAPHPCAPDSSRRTHPSSCQRSHQSLAHRIPATHRPWPHLHRAHHQAERLWAIARYTGADPAALQIEVTGVQFAWYFRYTGPDAVFGRTKPTLVDPGAANPLGIDPADPNSAGDFVTSELVIPSGRQVDLRLRSQDVIHGFAIPELRLKQNAVPGQTIHLHFTPTTPGTYAILCTQLCGTGHYRMNANLRILPPEQFAAWIVQHTGTSNHP